MIKRVAALILAVLTCFVVSVGAFAAVPTDEESTSLTTGNEFLDSVFSDWAEAGEQAIVLRDTFKQFLYNVCTNAGIEKILGDAKEIPIAWLRATKAGLFALTPYDNIYYWIVNGNLVFDDRTSGESVKKTVDQSQTIKDPTIYVPTPWMDVVQSSSGSSSGGSSGGGGGGGNTDISGIFSTVGGIIPNFFDGVLKPVIAFCTTNTLTLIFLGIGFIGIGIRYMRRVTNAFGRGR